MLTRGDGIRIEFELRIFLVRRSAPNKPGEPAPLRLTLTTMIVELLSLQ
jgi:hypothetical protein